MAGLAEEHVCGLFYAWLYGAPIIKPTSTNQGQLIYTYPYSSRPDSEYDDGAYNGSNSQGQWTCNKNCYWFTFDPGSNPSPSSAVTYNQIANNRDLWIAYVGLKFGFFQWNADSNANWFPDEKADLLNNDIDPDDDCGAPVLGNMDPQCMFNDTADLDDDFDNVYDHWDVDDDGDGIWDYFEVDTNDDHDDDANTEPDGNFFIGSNCVDNDDDGTIISPVFDEISLETYSKIKDSGNFIFLDPQGFLRQKNSNDEVSFKKNNLDLKNIDAIKMNPDELHALTGLTGTDGIKQLQKLGIEYVLYTNKQEISLLVKDKLYTIHLPKMTLTDTTGVGDIFCSTFVCTMLKEKDFLWALSFAGGAAQSALESKAFGLEKVPEKNALENNGSYFYNMVEFKQI